MNELAVATDRDQPAGKPTVVDVLAEVGVDAGEARGRHSDIGRIALELDCCHHRRRYDITGRTPLVDLLSPARHLRPAAAIRRPAQSAALRTTTPSRPARTPRRVRRAMWPRRRRPT